MTTYTQHRLSDRILQLLSQVINGPRPDYGIHARPLKLLKLRGLVTIPPHGKKRGMASATDAGREALAHARKEGW